MWELSAIYELVKIIASILQREKTLEMSRFWSLLIGKAEIKSQASNSQVNLRQGSLPFRACSQPDEITDLSPSSSLTSASILFCHCPPSKHVAS